MDYTHSAHKKPGPHTHKKRSAARARKEKSDRKTIAAAHTMCEACGERPAVDVAHLLGKKMGGTWDAYILSIGNKRAWCRECHNEDHGIFTGGKKT